MRVGWVFVLTHYVSVAYKPHRADRASWRAIFFAGRREDWGGDYPKSRVEQIVDGRMVGEINPTRSSPIVVNRIQSKEEFSVLRSMKALLSMDLIRGSEMFHGRRRLEGRFPVSKTRGRAPLLLLPESTLAVQRECSYLRGPFIQS